LAHPACYQVEVAVVVEHYQPGSFGCGSDEQSTNLGAPSLAVISKGVSCTSAARSNTGW
jgi:hypothetical protein